MSDNTEKVAQLERVLGETLGQVLQHEFFGKAFIELSIGGGVIQEIRSCIEKIES